MSFDIMYTAGNHHHSHDVYSISIAPKLFLMPLHGPTLPSPLVPDSDLLSVTMVLLFLKSLTSGNLQ